MKKNMMNKEKKNMIKYTKLPTMQQYFKWQHFLCYSRHDGRPPAYGSDAADAPWASDRSPATVTTAAETRHAPSTTSTGNEPPRGKTNNVVSEQVRHKQGCTSTDYG